jgi:23S rRNA (adenine2503-C2)-methyltransferase
LDTFKIPTLIRGTKGDDVLAACGQLNSTLLQTSVNPQM